MKDIEQGAPPPSRSGRQPNADWRAFVDSVDAADGEWVSMDAVSSMNNAASNTHRAYGMKHVEAALRDGRIYARLR